MLSRLAFDWSDEYIISPPASSSSESTKLHSASSQVGSEASQRWIVDFRFAKINLLVFAKRPCSAKRAH